MLELWSRPPGEILDPRIMATMAYSLVPLYVALFALAAHATIVLSTPDTSHTAP